MSNSVLISFNNTNEERFASNLADSLHKKGIESAWGDPNRAEPGMQKELLTAKWLVVILTPEAVKSPHVQSLVNTAFTYISQGRMLGILALAFLTNPVDLEDLPSSLWSTIRIYYTGGDADHQQAFEKLSRTLSNTKVPVRAVSSPATNWASSFSSASSTASRPLPPLPQPTRGARFSLRNRLYIGLALFAILVIIGSIILVFSRPLTATGPTLTATAAAQARATLTAIAKANTTSTAQALATAKAIFTNPKPDILYNYVTDQTPAFTDLDLQNTNQNHSCPLNNGISNDGNYTIQSSISGRFGACLAKNQVSKDFAFQIQVSLMPDDVGGLIFRSNRNATTFYLFSLENEGASYTLVECKPCTDSTPPTGTPLSEGSINPSQQPGTLTIIVYNNTFYLYVNQQAVGQPVHINQEDDSTSIPGHIGLYATSATQPANVAFNTVDVWNLP